MTAVVEFERSTLPHPETARGTYSAAIGAEWTKLRSVKSTVWSLMITIVIVVGLGALLCAAIVARWDQLDPIDRLTFDPTAHSLSGIFLAQLAIGVLGVLVIGSEYTTGAIRTTFAATPRRRTVIAAKATVLAAVAFAVSVVACFTAFGLGQVILQGKHIGTSLGRPEVLRAVLGGAVYLTAVAIIGFSMATVVRRTPGALAALFAVVLVLPILSNALPSPWDNNVSKLLPATAGETLFSTRASGELLTTGHAVLVLAIWVAVTFAGAMITVSRRDV
ncbi:MAG: putative transporter transrane protein [Ilumatobacteraceae bacterium]|nr:putative transporter transrane protein [Ilumatobacteraceae bacterium]